MFCMPLKRATTLVVCLIVIVTIAPYFFFELQKHYSSKLVQQKKIASYEVKTETYVDEGLEEKKEDKKPFFKELMENPTDETEENEHERHPIINTTPERHEGQGIQSNPLKEKIKETRRKIVQALLEMEDPEGKMSSLIPDLGGVPRRCLLLGAFRTGSSFLGQVLSSNDAIYYIYEPLHSSKVYKFGRATELAKEKTELISNYMKCNFSQAEYVYKTPDHLKWMSGSNAFEGENNVTFMNNVCRMFPYQVFKTTRYRGPIAHMLLEDETINPKIIMLVRDPRGAYLSRQNSEFCLERTCLNITKMCEEMHEDYVAAKELEQKYPGRFMKIRYEELSLDISRHTQQLMDFCELPYTYTTKKYLNSHTKEATVGIFSTVRKTSDVPFKWTRILSGTRIQEIQTKCKTVMQEWGYKIFDSASSVRNAAPENTIT